jgi:hypothetical protein
MKNEVTVHALLSTTESSFFHRLSQCAITRISGRDRHKLAVTSPMPNELAACLPFCATLRPEMRSRTIETASG